MKLKAIMNLQEQGEHAKCGDGINPATGFSYDPETLSKNGIMYYNYGWEDWGVPDMSTMLNIVKVMDSVISNGGKVLVHCHAGMGRTGLAIGCYMLYSREYRNLAEVIQLVKGKRKKAFSNAPQTKFIKVFAELLKELWVLFPEKMEEKISFKDCLMKQNYLLHGTKRKSLRNCPILVHEVCERVWLLYRRSLISSNLVAAAIIGRVQASEDMEPNIANIKKQLNIWDWNALYNCNDPIILVQIMLDFLEDFSLPAIDKDHVQKGSEGKYCFEEAELGLMKSIAKIFRAIMTEEVNPKVRDTAIYRVAIALLGLKRSEAKCFMNRVLIDWEFTNSEIIEAMREYLENLFREEGGSTPCKSSHAYSEKATIELPSPKSASTPVKNIQRNIGLNEYRQLAINIASLPGEEQLECIDKFDRLMKEVQNRSFAYTKSANATPRRDEEAKTIRKSCFADTVEYISLKS